VNNQPDAELGNATVCGSVSIDLFGLDYRVKTGQVPITCLRQWYFLITLSTGGTGLKHVLRLENAWLM
jgi:hypothetical protein